MRFTKWLPRAQIPFLRERVKLVYGKASCLSVRAWNLRWYRTKLYTMDYIYSKCCFCFPVHTHTDPYMNIYTYIHTRNIHTCTYIYTHAHAYIYTYMHHIHAYIFIMHSPHTYTYVHTYTYMQRAETLNAFLMLIRQLCLSDLLSNKNTNRTI